MYINKAILYGNLTKDPELKALPSGIQVANLSVATNGRFKDKSGNWTETPDYHNVVVFSKQAETVAQYLRKGSGIMVEGRMQTRSWDGPDGQKKYRTEVIADRIQFGPKVGAATGGPTGGSSGFSKPAAPSKDAPKDEPAGGAIDYPEEEINAEDIPF